MPDREGRTMLEALDVMAARKSEPLCEELAEHLTTTGNGMVWVMHPLVHSILFTGMAYLLNDQLRGKQAALVQARTSHDWHRFVFLHERPYRVRALLSVSCFISDFTYWGLARSVWTDSENIWQWGDEEIRDLLLTRKGRKSIMSSGDARAFLAVPSEFTIYRGWHEPGTAFGWSWTLRQEQAQWFANRMLPGGSEPRVEAFKVRRSDVIALFTERGEDEIVADPAVVFGRTG